MDEEGRQDRTQSGGWFKKLTNWFRRRRPPQLEPGDSHHSDKIEDTRLQNVPAPDIPETESTEADQNQLRLPNNTENQDTANTSVSTAQLHDSPRLADNVIMNNVENNVVPQLTSNIKRLVPGSSTELWVSPTILHRSPPPAVMKLGDTTQMMSVLPTPPNSRIKAESPRRTYYKHPKHPFTNSPFFKNPRNPQLFENVDQRKIPFKINQGSIYETTSVLDSRKNVMVQNTNLEKGETDGGKEEVEENEQRRDFGKRLNHGHRKQQMDELVGKLGEGYDESEKNILRPSTSSTVAVTKHVGAISDAGSRSSPHVPSLIKSNSRMEGNTITQHRKGLNLKLNEEQLHSNQWKTNVVLERHPKYKIADPMESNTIPPPQVASSHTSSSPNSLRMVNREDVHLTNTNGTLKRKQNDLHHDDQQHEKFIRSEENERSQLQQHERHGSYNERTINLDNKSGPTSTLLRWNEANIPISNVSQLTIQKEKDTYKDVEETNNEIPLHSDKAMTSIEIQDGNNDQETHTDGTCSFTNKSSNQAEHKQIANGIQQEQFLQEVDEVPRILINGQQNLQNIEARLAINHGVEEGSKESTSENQLTLQQNEEEEKEIGMIPGQNCGMRKSAGNRMENEKSGNERMEKQSDQGSDDLFNEIGEDKPHASGKEQKSARIQPEKATFQEEETLQDVVIWDGIHEIGDHFVIDFNDLVSVPLTNSEDECVTKLSPHGIHCEQESNDVKAQGISRVLLQERNHIEEEEISNHPETQEYVTLHFTETINNVEEEITGIPLPIGNTSRNMETLNWQNVQDTNQSTNQNVNATDEFSNIIEPDRIIEGIQAEPNIQQVHDPRSFLHLHNQQYHEHIEAQSAPNNRMDNPLPDPIVRNEILPTQFFTVNNPHSSKFLKQISRESSPSTSNGTTLKRKRRDLKDRYRTKDRTNYRNPKSQKASVTSQIGKGTNQDAREVEETDTENLSSNQEKVSKKQKVDSKNASTFLCGIYGQTFKNEGGYKLHEIRHEGEEPYKFKCPAPKCDKRFLDERKMKRHFVNHTKNFRCMDCNMSFASQWNLNQHKTIHTGERPFICEYCGTRFRTKYKLQDHLRIHTGERPYTCNDCDQTFKTSTVLFRHMETHSGRRPYSCDVCHKSFTRKCSKILHMITHSRVRPYTCDVCDKSFTRKGSKTRHMKQFHKNQLQDTNEGKDIEPQPCTSRSSNNILNSFKTKTSVEDSTEEFKD
ncbi:unnamed protein product [Orchesella dallaii]|uniref:C2H2-type domain-containing protein n=1 Tax=Orchesella dallaii TaxID=48710 RepID=A0ABP1S4Y1_9HEXA